MWEKSHCGDPAVRVSLHLGGDEAVHHQFSPRLVEFDGQLGAVHGNNGAGAKFGVEHTRSLAEGQRIRAAPLERSFNNGAWRSRPSCVRFAQIFGPRLRATPAWCVVTRSKIGLATCGAIASKIIGRSGKVFVIDMVGGQLLDESRRQRRLPEPADTPVGGVINLRLSPSSGQSDIGEPPLLLEPGEAAIVERALMRK